VGISNVPARTAWETLLTSYQPLGKATSEPETDAAAAAAAEDLQPNGDKSDENTDGKKKKAPAKPRARSKKVKKEPTPEQAAEGGDNGLCTYFYDFPWT
jgi:hypothetical protein